MPLSLYLFFANLLFLFFIILLKSNKSKKKNNKLPPQPWKLPLLGNLHNFIGADQPHRTLARLACKLGPIVRLQLGEVSAIVVSSSSVAKEIMKTHDLSFADRPKLLMGEIVLYNYASIGFAPYGEYWRQMRKICTLELLSAKKVRSFQSTREIESWNLVKVLANNSSQRVVNLTEKIYTLMNTIIFRAMVGSVAKDQEQLLLLIDELMYLASGFDLSDLFPSIKILPRVTGMRNRLRGIRARMDVILDDVILEHQQRHAAGGQNSEEITEDLLDVLLRLKDDDGLEIPLTLDNIKAVFLVGTPLLPLNC
ncbi:premnaspirodiene oxygenase [Artemisia annua]|uniref:Premnaspirodiene oxygenase n=1 Tax=Artemisia annua TaxID=35608 RepID=A0A2U1PQI3_ARTAN|nr:premnaspirodiene oxygenase [Artemisia annua]